MDPNPQPAPPKRFSWMRWPSAAFWLQAGACAVVGYSLLHGLAVSPAAAVKPPDAPAPAAPAPSAAPLPAAQQAQLPSLEGAALSTLDVTVARNDTLDGIFRRLKLNLADLASLRALPRVRAALDSLRPGESLHFEHRDGSLYGLERRLNESEMLKVSRDPQSGLRAEVEQNPLEMRMRTVRGVITSSLFEAVAAAGAHDQTAVALADIFGWDVDFVLDVRPGDAFVVTYPEIWRDGVYVRDGAIQAAEFVNQGRDFKAVRYTDADGGSHYYTPDGRSLHKAFLRAPVEFTRVSSRFNSARHHPILNLIRAHKGVDYAAPLGTPVRAAGDGRVRFARGTHVGSHVTQGLVIAYVGMTGLATGPHLHYEYRVNGVFKNPQTVSLPGANPIEARWRDDFLAKSAPLLATLAPASGPMLVSR